MSFEVRATDLGPIIIHDNKFFSLVSEDGLLDVFHEDPSLFEAMQDHIEEELNNSFAEYVEGFVAGINAPVGKIYAYIGASQQFLILKNMRFPQYVEAIRQAEEE
jgi:hypothetical protein